MTDKVNTQEKIRTGLLETSNSTMGRQSREDLRSIKSSKFASHAFQEPLLVEANESLLSEALDDSEIEAVGNLSDMVKELSTRAQKSGMTSIVRAAESSVKDLEGVLAGGFLRKLFDTLRGKIGQDPFSRSEVLVNQLLTFQQQLPKLISQFIPNPDSTPTVVLNTNEKWNALKGALSNSLTPRGKGVIGTPYLNQKALVDEIGNLDYASLKNFFVNEQEIQSDFQLLAQISSVLSKESQEMTGQQPETPASSNSAPQAPEATQQQPVTQPVKTSTVLKQILHDDQTLDQSDEAVLKSLIQRYLAKNESTEKLEKLKTLLENEKKISVKVSWSNKNK